MSMSLFSNWWKGRGWGEERGKEERWRRRWRRRRRKWRRWRRQRRGEGGREGRGKGERDRHIQCDQNYIHLGVQVKEVGVQGVGPD